MKRRETIFDFGAQVFLIFGFSILCLNIFCMLFGESASPFSTMFELGTAGLTVVTMLQFFLLSVIIVSLKFLFFTDILIKNISVKLRTAGMFGTVILVLVLFIFLFGWFPVDMWLPWVLFFICFGGSAAVSMVLSILKERTENKEMAEALERLKSVKLENCGRETVIPMRHRGAGSLGGSGNGSPGTKGELKISDLFSEQIGTKEPEKPEAEESKEPEAAEPSEEAEEAEESKEPEAAEPSEETEEAEEAKEPEAAGCP
ncbi:MAG: hypothetical protein K2O06_11750 [Acetatifactor sp.]|nr:hypothetical protein [Acetatifactor sp.]